MAKRLILCVTAALPLQLAVSPVASAHFSVTDPMPQPGMANYNQVVCSGSDTPMNVTQYSAGATITVAMTLTTPHSPFTFDVILMGQGADQTLANNATPTDGSGVKEITGVVLPNVACDNCVLEIRQDNSGGNPYYQCANIKIVAAVMGGGGSGGMGTGGADAGGAGGALGSGGVMPVAGSGGVSTIGGMGGVEAPGTHEIIDAATDDACSIAHKLPGSTNAADVSPALLGFLFSALGLVRRRRRAHARLQTL